MQDPGDQQLLNNQNQNYSGGDGRHNVPNIILTGGYQPESSRPLYEQEESTETMF